MKKFAYSLGLFMLIMLTAHNVSAQVYDFQNISLLSRWDDPSIPPEPVYSIRYNGIWGWDDGNGNEYAIIGASNGVYFINVTDPVNPVVADFVPGRRDSCIWREIKTFGQYAYLISDDSPPNSFQIVDLQYLPDSVSVVYDDNTLFERAHTMWVDGNKLYCALVKGGQFTYSPMTVFSLANPTLPTVIRQLELDVPSLASGQVHDMFVRNDTVYASAAFQGLYILRLNNTSNQFSIEATLTTYPQQGYNHSSALTDDGNTLVFMDEVPAGLGVKVLDVSDFSNLTIKTVFQSNVGPTPHNPFIIGKTCFIAYYQDGLQVYDVSDPANPVRLGYFDTHFQTAMGGPYSNPPYAGAWGAYPFLPSGNVLVSDMQNGLYVLDVSALSTGLPQPSTPEEPGFSIYPNPVSQGAEIIVQQAVPGPDNVDLRICDLQGREVYTAVFSGQKFTLKDIGLNKGIYLVSLESKGHKSLRKLVVE